MKKKIVLLACLCSAFSLVTKAQTPVISTTFQSTAATTGTGASHLEMFNGSATAPQKRWILGMIGNEDGSDGGSNFRIFRYNDAGNFLSSSLSIDRKTGFVTMPYGSGVVGNTTGTANLSFFGFYESNGTTRQGYVGKGSGAINDTYLGSDIAGISLFAFDGMITLRNATKNMINFGNAAGFGVPAINTRSAGTKIILHDAVTPTFTNVDYAIGTDQSGGATHGWFSVPTNSYVHYWNFYGGTASVARLDGEGNFTTVGSVVVGSTAAQRTLKVNGDITARKLKITQTGWPDYVFSADYKLPSLQEINNYIKVHHHLPNVPAAAEI